MMNPFFDIETNNTSAENADIPVWRGSAASKMKIDVAVNGEGKVVILHEQAFPAYLEWVEFDAATGEMTFVTAGGKVQDLGMIIHAPMNKHVARALEVCTVCVRNDEIRDMGMLPLIVRNKDGGST